MTTLTRILIHFHKLVFCISVPHHYPLSMSKKDDFDEGGFNLSFFYHCIRVIKLSLWDTIRRMFDFSGRTSRAPFWIAFVFFGLCALNSLACEIWAENWNLGESESAIKFTFKGARYLFLFFLASLFVRRNHDLGLSIWAVFNPLDSSNHTPFSRTSFWEKGDSHENKFGPPHILW